MAASARHLKAVTANDVAEGLVVANCHRGERFEDLPPASGAEVCWALRRHGLQARLDGPDWMWLERDGVPVVRVPLVDRLRPGLLRVILTAVDLTPEVFAEYLARG
jgi:hypothetical protein